MARRSLAIITTALLALGFACNSDDDDTSSSTTTTTSPEAEVEAAYLAYRDMVTRLLESPDPDDPEIAERTRDQNEVFLVERLTTLVDQGQHLRFGPDYSYEVLSVSIDGDEAVVRDCTVDDAQTVSTENGDVVSEGTTTELLEATLRRDAEKWQVVTIDGVGHWDGAVTCED